MLYDYSLHYNKTLKSTIITSIILLRGYQNINNKLGHLFIACIHISIRTFNILITPTVTFHAFLYIHLVTFLLLFSGLYDDIYLQKYAN